MKSKGGAPVVLRCHVDECSPYRIAGWVDDDGPVEAIEIAVDGRRVAALSPTEYRKDLEDAGIGDGCRSFRFVISPHLVGPTNVVTIRRGKRILHSATLQPPNLDAPRSAPAALRWHIDECSSFRIAGWVDRGGPVDAIEIAVNGESVATISPTEYRRDLDDAGIGDGRRSFSFGIGPYLLEPANLVTIRHDQLILHSATLQPSNLDAAVGACVNAPLIEHLISRGLRETERDFFLGLWHEHFDADWYLQTYPDVAEKGFEAFDHFLRYGLKEGLRPGAGVPLLGSSRPVGDAEIHCLKPPVVGGEVALFATYSPIGRLKPYVRHYLDSLKRHNIAVILIVAADRPFVADPDLVSAVDGLFVRQNQGLDFGSWAHVLRLHPELFNVKILYLINDSVLGPTNDAAFGRLLERVRDSRADCIGLTENFVWAWHYQSYFQAFKNRALCSDIFHKFIYDIVAFTDKQDIINQYEYRLAWLLKTAGLELNVLFPVPHFGDPTIFDWDSLLQMGFPFLKVNTVREAIPNVDTSGWRDLLAAAGFDVSLAEGTLDEISVAACIAEKEIQAPAIRWSGIHRSLSARSARALRPPRRVRPNGGSSSRLNVLICGHELSESGAPRAAFDVARVLRAAGHSVVFASPKDGPYRERLCNIGVEVIIDETLFDQHRSSFHLAHHFDKVFCNTIVCWPIVAQIRNVLPVYWYVHESEILHQMVSEAPPLLPVLRGGVTVLAPSSRAANALAVYGLKVRLIEYGIDDPAEWRRARSPKGEKVVIGVFGSYELRKGQDLAVAGMLRVPKELRDQAELRFFGRTLNPVFRDNLEQIAANERSIVFFGEVNHRECLHQMAACDVVLSPSRDDPLPFVTLDALSLGKTVVCSHSTGTAAYLQDGQSGLILQQNTPEEIGRVLTRTIADPGLRTVLGKGARALYKRIFTMRSFAERLRGALGIERPRGKTRCANRVRKISASAGQNAEELTAAGAAAQADCLG